MCLEQVVRIGTACLTPIIAIVATYIAWQQWQTNRTKLLLDRYDRRLRVYEEVTRILSLIARDAKANTEDLLKFRAAVSEADFLFGSEIPSYIGEIYKRGLNLWRLSQEYRDLTQPQPPGYNHQSVVEGMDAELRWLVDQFEPAKHKFKKYLDISQ